MVSSLNVKLFLVAGFLEAFLMSLASPMTQGVLLSWVRCVCYALGLGIAAVLHLSVVLSNRKPGEALDPASVAINAPGATA